MIELYLNYTNSSSTTLEFSYMGDSNVVNELEVKYINIGIWDATVFKAFKFLSLVEWDTFRFNVINDIAYSIEKGARLLKEISIAPFSNHDAFTINQSLSVCKELNGKINHDDLFIFKDYYKGTIISLPPIGTIKELNTIKDKIFSAFKFNTYGLLNHFVSTITITDFKNIDVADSINLNKLTDKDNTISNELYSKTVHTKDKDVNQSEYKSFIINKNVNYNDNNSITTSKENPNTNLDQYTSVSTNDNIINKDTGFTNIYRDVFNGEVSAPLFYNFYLTKDIFTESAQSIYREYKHIPTIGDVIFLPKPEKNPVIQDNIFGISPERNILINNDTLSLEHVILRDSLGVFNTAFLSKSESNLGINGLSWFSKDKGTLNCFNNIVLNTTNRGVSVNSIETLDAVILDLYCYGSSMLERFQKEIKDSGVNQATFVFNNSNDVYIARSLVEIDTLFFNLSKVEQLSFSDRLTKEFKDLTDSTMIPITDNKRDMSYRDTLIIIDSIHNSLFVDKTSIAITMYGSSVMCNYSDINIDSVTQDATYLSEIKLYTNQIFINPKDIVSQENILSFDKSNNDTYIDRTNISIQTTDFPCSYFYPEIRMGNIINDIKIGDTFLNLCQNEKDVFEINIGTSFCIDIKDTLKDKTNKTFRLGSKDTMSNHTDVSVIDNSIDSYYFPSATFINMNALPLVDSNKYYNFVAKIPLTLGIESESVFVSKRGNLTALANALIKLDSGIKDTNSGSLMIAIDTSTKDINIKDITIVVTSIMIDASYKDNKVSLKNVTHSATINDSVIRFDSTIADIGFIDSNIRFDDNIKNLTNKSNMVFINGSITNEIDISDDGIYFDGAVNNVYTPNSKLINFSIDLMLKLNKQQLPVIKKIIEVKDMESLSEKITKDDINVFMKSSVFILEKGKLDTILPAWKQINANKDLRDIMFNQGAWVYDPNGWHPDLTAGGIDELLLPQNDFDYSVFKIDLLDPVTHLPKQQVQMIDATTFIVKRPTSHPLPECNNIGREYADVDVNLLKQLINQFYNMWQANIYKFGAVDMRDAVGQMLDLIGAYVAYNVPDFLIPASERVIRLMRWYGEAAIMRNAEYVIHIQYEPLKSELYNGTCSIPNVMDNMFIDMKKFSIANQDISTDCSIEFTLDNPIATTISFGAYLTSGSLGIYINDIEVDTISNSIGVISYSIDKAPTNCQNKVKLYFHNYAFNGIINLANIIIDNYVYSDLVTEYSPSLGTGNKVLDEMIKTVSVYADLYDNNAHFMQDTINGNLAVTDLIDQLQRYFLLHHDKKSKGKRLIIKT